VLAVDALRLALAAVRRQCAPHSPHLDPTAAAAAAKQQQQQHQTSASASAKNRASGGSGAGGSGASGSGSGSGKEAAVLPGAGFLVTSLYECLSVICRAADGSWVALKVAGLVRFD
jgi:hypothetical protein